MIKNQLPIYQNVLAQDSNKFWQKDKINDTSLIDRFHGFIIRKQKN